MLTSVIAMSTAGAKIKVATDEVRMLVLSTQVLISAQYEAPFASAAAELPRTSLLLILAACALLLAALVILLSGCTYHRLVAHGDFRSAVHTALSVTTSAALLPLSLALGIDLFIVTNNLIGVAYGVAISAMGAITAVGLWFAWGLAARITDAEKNGMNDNETTPIHEQVSQVLTEARVVLPGAQAMLGFAFLTMLTREFDHLPKAAKSVHLFSFCMIALTVILLMTPAAFHRIAERGRDTRRVVRVASIMTVSAMIPLALGLAGGLYVVVRKILDSNPAAMAAAMSFLCFAGLLWFGPALVMRRR
jgi:hypothetical protein